MAEKSPIRCFKTKILLLSFDDNLANRRTMSSGTYFLHQIPKLSFHLQAMLLMQLFLDLLLLS